MSNVRQYIGARYVFKIYENSTDASSAEWEQGVNYEPLTIVTYLNSTYASKKDVPASVGNPASNPSYWILTGAYNGQIATLQQQIDNINNVIIPTIQDDIDNVNTRVDNISFTGSINSLTPSEILLITDSFGQNPDGNVLTGFNKCLNGVNMLAVGGANFSTFASMLTNYTGDKTTIKSVILIGGTNEHDVSQIASRMAEVKVASSYYPNADIFIAFIKSNFSSTSERSLVNSLLTEIKKECNTNGFKFLGNFNHCLYPTFVNVSSDSVHPTPSGGERIGSAIFNMYANGKNEPLISSTFTGTDKGLTFLLLCNTNNELSIVVSGTTTEAIPAGSYQSMNLGYYYLPSMADNYRFLGVPLSNGGRILFGYNNGELKYYYSPDSSGVGTLPSGTSINSTLVTIAPLNEKKYAITN